MTAAIKRRAQAGASSSSRSTGTSTPSSWVVMQKQMSFSCQVNHFITFVWTFAEKNNHYVYDGKINYSTEKLVILTLLSIPVSAHYGKPTSVWYGFVRFILIVSFSWVKWNSLIYSSSKLRSQYYFYVALKLFSFC